MKSATSSHNSRQKPPSISPLSPYLKHDVVSPFEIGETHLATLDEMIALDINHEDPSEGLEGVRPLAGLEAAPFPKS